MSYQQYFVVVSTVIPVFFLSHVIQYKDFLKAKAKSWFLLPYAVIVLGSSAAGEFLALQYVYATGFPEYSTERMPVPDESVSTAKGVLLLIVIVLIVFTVAPALAGDPPPSQSAAHSVAEPLQVLTQNGRPTGRTTMAIGLAALAVSALIVRAQKRVDPG